MSNEAYTLKKEADAAKYLLAALADEVGEDEELRTTVVEGETSLLEAVDRTLRRIAEVKGHQKTLKEEKARISARAERFEALEETLGKALKRVIEETGIGKQERPLATVGTAKLPPRVVITAEHNLPDEFFKPQDPKLDLAGLTRALKEGRKIEGASLEPHPDKTRINLSWK